MRTTCTLFFSLSTPVSIGRARCAECLLDRLHLCNYAEGGEEQAHDTGDRTRSRRRQRGTVQQKGLYALTPPQLKIVLSKSRSSSSRSCYAIADRAEGIRGSTAGFLTLRCNDPSGGGFLSNCHSTPHLSACKVSRRFPSQSVHGTPTEQASNPYHLNAGQAVRLRLLSGDDRRCWYTQTKFSTQNAYRGMLKMADPKSTQDRREPQIGVLKRASSWRSQTS